MESEQFELDSTSATGVGSAVETSDEVGSVGDVIAECG